MPCFLGIFNYNNPMLKSLRKELFTDPVVWTNHSVSSLVSIPLWNHILEEIAVDIMDIRLLIDETIMKPLEM